MYCPSAAVVSNGSLSVNWSDADDTVTTYWLKVPEIVVTNRAHRPSGAWWSKALSGSTGRAGPDQLKAGIGEAASSSNNTFDSETSTALPPKRRSCGEPLPGRTSL